MIVYAVNVHTGGGKVLLDELLLNEPFGKVTALLHDERYEAPLEVKGRYTQLGIYPSLFRRLKAEFDLIKLLQANSNEFVLFFGNLPPLFAQPKNSALYLQNCILLPKVKIHTYSLKTFLRLSVEKLILKFKIRSVSEVWVQTDWMVQGLSPWRPLKVLKKPFLPTLPAKMSIAKDYDFLTVASQAKHKNLQIFINALRLLDKMTMAKIKIAVVLDNVAILNSKLLFQGENITLDILTNVSRPVLFETYQKSKVMVLNSLYESYSLPLYEALHFGLRVICPDLAYTDEVKTLVTRYHSKSAQDLADKMLKFIE